MKCPVSKSECTLYGSIKYAVSNRLCTYCGSYVHDYDKQEMHFNEFVIGEYKGEI